MHNVNTNWCKVNINTYLFSISHMIRYFNISYDTLFNFNCWHSADGCTKVLKSVQSFFCIINFIYDFESYIFLASILQSIADNMVQLTVPSDSGQQLQLKLHLNIQRTRVDWKTVFLFHKQFWYCVPVTFKSLEYLAKADHMLSFCE